MSYVLIVLFFLDGHPQQAAGYGPRFAPDITECEKRKAFMDAYLEATYPDLEFISVCAKAPAKGEPA